MPTVCSSKTLFQRIVFLVRDFEFSDYKWGYYDENACPEDQKLNFMVEKLQSNSKHAADVKETHAQILGTFASSGVYLMPLPDKKLRLFDKIDNLQADFQEHLRAFVELMVSNPNIVKKQMNGSPVTGKEFKSYAIEIGKLFDAGKLPEIQNLYAASSKVQYEDAKAAAILAFQDAMQQFINQNPAGVQPEVLKREIVELSSNAAQVFHSRPKIAGFLDYENQFRLEFGPELERVLESFVKHNENNLRNTQVQREGTSRVDEAKHRLSAIMAAKREAEDKAWLEKQSLVRRLEETRRYEEEQRERIVVLDQEVANLSLQLN
jgi:hypothetical protein